MRGETAVTDAAWVSDDTRSRHRAPCPWPLLTGSCGPRETLEVIERTDGFCGGLPVLHGGVFFVDKPNSLCANRIGDRRTEEHDGLGLDTPVWRLNLMPRKTTRLKFWESELPRSSWNSMCLW